MSASVKLRDFLLVAVSLAPTIWSCKSATRPSASENSQLEAAKSKCDDTTVEGRLKCDKFSLGSQKVHIFCFYGKNNHSQVVIDQCEAVEKSCNYRYGSKNCVEHVNPTPDEVTKTRTNGISVVVTHSTPEGTGKDAQVSIWNSKVTPEQFAAKGNPTIWFGCFGKAVANQYPSIIPLQDKPIVLDTTPPQGAEIFCRFKATFFCLEENIKASKYNTPEEIRACVGETMSKLKEFGDSACQ